MLPLTPLPPASADIELRPREPVGPGAESPACSGLPGTDGTDAPFDVATASSRDQRSNGRLRVLRLITRLNVGGPARHVAILQEGLARRGWEGLLVHGSVHQWEASLDS